MVRRPLIAICWLAFGLLVSLTPLSHAIVNGVVTTDFPAVGTVHDIRDPGRLRGNGTLISTTQVVTTANIVTGLKPARLVVMLNGEYRHVARVHVHPDYNAATLAYNVAVLELDRAVLDVTPIPAATAAPAPGDTVTIVGYGSGGTPAGGSDGVTGTKRQGTNVLTTVNAIDFTWIFDSADEANVGSGDSGAPSLVWTGEGWRVAGIASLHTILNSSLGDQVTSVRLDPIADFLIDPLDTFLPVVYRMQERLEVKVGDARTRMLRDGFLVVERGEDVAYAILHWVDEDGDHHFAVEPLHEGIDAALSDELFVGEAVNPVRAYTAIAQEALGSSSAILRYLIGKTEVPYAAATFPTAASGRVVLAAAGIGIAAGEAQIRLDGRRTLGARTLAPDVVADGLLAELRSFYGFDSVEETAVPAPALVAGTAQALSTPANVEYPLYVYVVKARRTSVIEGESLIDNGVGALVIDPDGSGERAQLIIAFGGALQSFQSLTLGDTLSSALPANGTDYATYLRYPLPQGSSALNVLIASGTDAAFEKFELLGTSRFGEFPGRWAGEWIVLNTGTFQLAKLEATFDLARTLRANGDFAQAVSQLEAEVLALLPEHED